MITGPSDQGIYTGCLLSSHSTLKAAGEERLIEHRLALQSCTALTPDLALQGLSYTERPVEKQ